MRYSVITKTDTTQNDEPYIFEKDAVLYFSKVLHQRTMYGAVENFTMFLVDNLTNKIITSYDSNIISLPVEYHDLKTVSTSTKEMIDNLHDLMEIRGITLTKLAIHSGVNVGNLCRFFKGDSNPTLKTYVRISNSINLL